MPVSPLPGCTCRSVVLDGDSKGARVSLVLPFVLELSLTPEVASDAASETSPVTDGSPSKVGSSTEEAGGGTRADVPEAQRCELSVRVLEDSNSGGHRFKVVGVALLNSRYSGALTGFDHPGLNVADGNEGTGWRSETKIVSNVRPMGIGTLREE